MNRPVIDYFRCPENFLQFQLAGPLSADSGFFSFGPQTICYGRTSSGFRSRRVTDPLHDALADVKVDEQGALRLPLDPNEIIENLHYERYVHSDGVRVSERPLVRAVYYGLRPLLPVRVRKHVQRRHFSDWQTIRFPHWPVDRTVEQILERLLVLAMKARGLERVPFVWFWPDGANGCAIMTHDVEERAGREFCSQLMDLDEAAGLKSSFQIVPEGRYPVSQGFLDEIRARGFEINIHDLNHDGRLFSTYDEFLRRVQRISQYAREYCALGFRSGALYRNQAWDEALEVSYDMSVPSVAHLEPQRGGCCSLMPFFIGRVLELPLTTIQDYSLFHVLNDYSIDLWKQQLSVIAKQHGLASFIVHPDYIIEKRARATYQTLLQYLARLREARALWIALPGEVARWWRERSQMTVVSDGTGWRIEGNGRERARLAFANLVGDTLTFTVKKEMELSESSPAGSTD